MANNNAPNGFSFVRNAVSASPTYQRTSYQIAHDNSNSFGKGDSVISLNTGYIDKWASGQILGVLDGLEYYDTALNKKIFANAWLAPSTALTGSVVAYVISDRNAIFQVQEGNGGPVTYASRGLNISPGGTGAPNTSTGISTSYADFATIATTNTLPYRIVDVPQNLGGVPTTNCLIGVDSSLIYNLIYVQFNNCDDTNTTGV